MSDIDNNSVEIMEIEDEIEYPVIVIEENTHECDEVIPSNSSEKNEKKTPPVRSPSAVWQHYEKIFDKEGIYLHTKCNYCSQKYSVKCSTTTLNDHFKKKHEKIQPKKVGSIEVAFTNVKSVQGEDCLNLSNKLVNWIIVECLPFRTVDSPFFHEFITGLNPKFQIPSRQTLRKKIDDKYIQYKGNIIKMFQVNLFFYF